MSKAAETDHKKFVAWCERHKIEATKQPLPDGGCAFTFRVEYLIIGGGQFKVSKRNDADAVTVFFDKTGAHYAGGKMLWDTGLGWA